MSLLLVVFFIISTHVPNKKPDTLVCKFPGPPPEPFKSLPLRNLLFPKSRGRFELPVIQPVSSLAVPCLSFF